MGMSMHVYVIRDMSGDSEFDRMVAAREACEAAGVPLPDEVRDYLNKVCEDGSDVSIDNLMANAGAVRLTYAACPKDCRGVLSDYKADMEEGFEVDITKLPAWASKIRFICSY